MARKGEAIYKRKDGRYEARFIKSYTNGKANYKYIYGKTYLETKRKRQQMIETYKESFDNSVSDITFETVLNNFIKSKENIIKDSSLSTYLYIINKHIKPELGNIKLKCLNQNIINNFINNKLIKL